MKEEKARLIQNFPDFIYQVDYGFIKSTKSQDGQPIDVFIGTSNNGVVGCLCILDILKKDSEIKVLYNCNSEEVEKATKMMSNGPMSFFVFYEKNE